MSRTPVFVLALAALAPISLRAQTAHDIVVRSITADEQNQKLVAKYTFKEHETTREMDGKGQVKSTKRTTREVLFVGGKRTTRVLEKDGKPLPRDEAQKEQVKIDKAFAEASKISEEEMNRRLEEERRNRAKNRERLKYVPDAYDLKLLGEENVDGRPAWIVQATPKGRYDGKYSNLFRNVQGKLWIDKRDYQWVKVDAEALNDISFGMFMAKISKGMHLKFEQSRVNDEVWLPRMFQFTGSARFLVKRLSLDEQVLFSDYRKFQADSRVVSIAEADESK